MSTEITALLKKDHVMDKGTPLSTSYPGHLTRRLYRTHL